MAGGWTRDGAVQEQIDASVEDAISRARRLLPAGAGLDHCEDCDEPIPEPRRRAIPGVRLCVDCQSSRESEDTGLALFNRRGSKDSQLR